MNFLINSYKQLFRTRPITWFFILYALWGFYTLPDFGVPLDEITQRSIGIINANYIGGKGNTQEVLQNGFFGPVFETTAYWLEQLVYKEPISVKLYMRHALLFSIFLLSIPAFYSLAKGLAKNLVSADIATALFATYPVLFAHAHYNSKDTLFLCLIIFVLYFFRKFTVSAKWKYLIWAGVFLGMASTIRLTGVFILGSLEIALLLAGKSKLISRIKRGAILFAIFLIGFYAFYPYLWIDFFSGIQNLFKYVSSNPWPWNTLAAGEEIVPGHLPWWYLPLWMGVTISIANILLFAVGFFLALKRIKKWSTPEMAIILTFILPFAYFEIFRPTIYNGWRHMQFLFVPISLMTVYSLDILLNWKFGKYAGWLFAAYSTLVFFLWHPYGYAYFNEAYAVNGKPGTYDMDYWGLSDLQCLKWIAEHDKSDSIAISSFTESPQLNAMILPEKTARRFHFITQQGKGKYEVEVRRGREFFKLQGETKFFTCPLKDTLARVVELR